MPVHVHMRIKNQQVKHEQLFIKILFLDLIRKKHEQF